MIDYIGDLSRADAELLRDFASESHSILEFGCGASTQILAAYGRGTVDSVETVPVWIKNTKRNLAELAITKPVKFYDYQYFQPAPGYDLIFVDGANEFRLPFALRTWPYLVADGVMCLHDTRRTVPRGTATRSDVQNLCAIIESHSTEIDLVVLNQDDSNISVIFKRAPLLLEDWNKIEGRTAKQLGLE